MKERREVSTEIKNSKTDTVVERLVGVQGSLIRGQV